MAEISIPLYRAATVCAVTGVSAVTLRSWHNRSRFQTAAEQLESGSHTWKRPDIGNHLALLADAGQRLYLADDILRVAVVESLTSLGVRLPPALTAVRDRGLYFLQWALKCAPEPFLICVGRRISKVGRSILRADEARGFGEVERMLSGTATSCPNSMLIVNVTALAQMVDQKLRHEIASQKLVFDERLGSARLEPGVSTAAASG